MINEKILIILKNEMSKAQLVQTRLLIEKMVKIIDLKKNNRTKFYGVIKECLSLRQRMINNHFFWNI